jgi:Ala-tRNA(Pro) deacylase
MTFEETLTQTLRNLGITFRRVEHEAVFTVAESKGVLPEKVPVKNLLLQEEKGDRKVLVVMAGDERMDTKKLARELGTKKLRFANAETLYETLGVTPGSVSLFSLLHDSSDGVEVVVDQTLVHEHEVGFHPNDNTATIFIPGAAIETILKQTGHTYTFLTLY